MMTIMMMIATDASRALLVFVLWLRLISSSLGYDLSQGHESCRCISADELPDWSENATNAIVADGLEPSTYGVGCAAHDVDSKECADHSCEFENSNILPLTGDGICDKSYCSKQWCYVDHSNCDLLNRRSILSETDRFYSYAACGDMDSYISNHRFEAVKGRVYKTGFNSNSGGWQGAYSDAKEQFKGPARLWHGPTVEFAKEAATKGGFSLNLTEPPEFLRDRSEAHFSSQSSFDFCVYATSLGYLDLCLAQYTISDLRATATDWLVLGSQDIYLVGILEEELSGWESFQYNMGLVFAPFTTSVWCFLVFFVIPVLGCLMIVHEYNHPGSAYPAKAEIISSSRRGSEIETRRVPMYRHIVRAIYISLLSVLQQTYEHSVVTYGALINLLGISFFILSIVAVYTANLAAILTQQAQTTTVASLDDALAANYRICGERKNVETIRAVRPDIDSSHLAVDPEDGQPGFNCPQCAARMRVFDFLDPKKAVDDESYCHAAFAPIEDLEVLQKQGEHCNKTIVGLRVGSVQTGIPINENVGTELVSYFLKAKNEGLFDREMRDGRPVSSCVDQTQGKEGDSLNIAQLTGIWIVSFGFAIAGLIITWLQPKIDKKRGKKVRYVQQYDQHGERVNVLEKHDKWMEEQSVVKGGRRVFVGQSRWGKMMAEKNAMTSSTRGSLHSRKRNLNVEPDEHKPNLKNLAQAALAANRMRNVVTFDPSGPRSKPVDIFDSVQEGSDEILFGEEESPANINHNIRLESHETPIETNALNLHYDESGDNDLHLDENEAANTDILLGRQPSATETNSDINQNHSDNDEDILEC